MTIYNITKLINFETMQSIKKYLNIDKLSLRYSDFFNEFGLYTKENCNQKKKEICIKYLVKKYNLMQYKISTLMKCPVIRFK